MVNYKCYLGFCRFTIHTLLFYNVACGFAAKRLNVEGEMDYKYEMLKRNF